MELQPIDYTQHASSQLCQMSFSDLLNQTSNNFDYNINSVSSINFYGFCSSRDLLESLDRVLTWSVEP